MQRQKRFDNEIRMDPPQFVKFSDAQADLRSLTSVGVVPNQRVTDRVNALGAE